MHEMSDYLRLNGSSRGAGVTEGIFLADNLGWDNGCKPLSKSL